MLLVAPVREQHRIEGESAQKEFVGIDKLNVCRSVIPAVTHVDYSARVQTVGAERNGRFYRVIKAFEEKTACPVVIDTSFNVRGEPIVCTPADAFRCFMSTDMDVLVIEDCVLMKEDQPESLKIDNTEYLAEFALD